MGYTVVQIADRLRTEADAWAFIEELRWPDGPVCSHCGNVGATFIQPTNGISRKTRTGAETQRRVWRCLDCRKQFSAITGTVFHGTRASLRTWVLVFFEMCYAKNGVSAQEVHRKFGVCPRTAWFMLHRIREAMKTDALVAVMRGTIIADETWIGGEPSNRHKNHVAPVPFNPSEGRRNAKTDKTSVLSLINAETGEVRSRIVPDVSGPTLRKAIAESVDIAGSTLWSDGWKGYRPFASEFIAHEWVDHSEGEYVRGDVTTNAAEGFFSQLKRSIDGTHHHVSVEHLPRYLAEFDFRYSTRKLTDTARMSRLMGQTGGRRLTYKRVSGH